MSIANKLNEIATNVPKVYDAGKLECKNFRMESAEFDIETKKASTNTGTLIVTLPISCGDAKAVVITADESVKDKISKTTDGFYYMRSIKLWLANNGKSENTRDAFGDAGTSTATAASAYPVTINEDGTITATVFSMMGGTYHWTAYYWDE